MNAHHRGPVNGDTVDLRQNGPRNGLASIPMAHRRSAMPVTWIDPIDYRRTATYTESSLLREHLKPIAP